MSLKNNGRRLACLAGGLLLLALLSACRSTEPSGGNATSPAAVLTAPGGGTPSEAAPTKKPRRTRTPATASVESAQATQPGAAPTAEPGASQAAEATPPAGETAAPQSPTESPQPPQPVVGVELHDLGPGGGMNLISDAGVTWTRYNGLIWSSVEPQEGERNWEALAGLEQGLFNAAQHNKQLILIVRSAPTWAQLVPNHFCAGIKPEKILAFARFMHDVVARYSVPPYNVKYFEVGNEPDIDYSLVDFNSVYGCWGDKNDPYYGGEAYGEVLKEVYPQVKAANPDAQLLTGGLLMDCDPVNPPETSPGSGRQKDCTSTLFLEGALKAGAGDAFDGVSFHAYDFYFERLGKYGNLNWNSTWENGPALIAKARYLRDLLAQYGYTDKYLINSEVALLCRNSGEEPICQTQDYLDTKAWYLAESYASAIAEGLRANIWFSITGWRGSGLVTASSLQPLPAYDALKFVASELQGVESAKALTDFPAVLGYEFTRDGRQVWILWATDDETHSVPLPSEPAAMYDVSGNSIPLSSEARVTLAPVFIEW